MHFIESHMASKRHTHTNTHGCMEMKGETEKKWKRSLKRAFEQTNENFKTSCKDWFTLRRVRDT